MKRALPDGRRKLVMTGVKLLEKLAPLIPPTYANLTRFHGVLSPTSRLRAQVVPRPTTTPTAQQTTKPSASSPPPTTEQTTTPSSPPSQTPATRSSYRLDWGALLKGVFAGARRVPQWVDVLELFPAA